MRTLCVLMVYCLFTALAAEKNSSLSDNQSTILILRHGETEWDVLGKRQGWEDIPLNEEGRRQARCVSEDLINTPITRVYASSLSRAVETAEIIAAPHKISVVADPVLRFYKHKKKWFDYLKTKKRREAEMRKEITTDALSYLKELSFQCPGQTVLIVTHRSVVKHILEGLGSHFPKNRVASNVEVIQVIGEDGFLFLEKGV